MFALAYVLIPFSSTPPAEAIADSLARFQRGRRGDVPDDWLRFFDHTEEVRTLHETALTFTVDRGLKVDGSDSWYLDTLAVAAEMERRGRERWTVRLADVEPDIYRFADRFVRTMERHPVTGGLGRWLNPLGEWDWWDLGGCYDGVLTGTPGPRGRHRSTISSGPCQGRAAFETLAEALETTFGQEPEPEIDVLNDDNVELVSTLLASSESDGGPRLPGTLVLPPGSAPDDGRWLSSWHDLILEREEGARQWQDAVRAAYGRHSDHWAAAVAYHF